ncbi:MAG: FlgD immunoglobulin-like domain containing protein, partial [Candidatus Krumholzibacteria bacterium]|nr:FlgD immunoglobulin-like domain containing protein [Candidatus Krumholzibacteria bacterium]
LVAEGNVIHMVYLENISGRFQVMYRACENLEWSEALPLTNASTGDRMVPTIAIGPDGSLHVAWGDTREDSLNVNMKIYYRRRTGGIWFDEEFITDIANAGKRPSMAVDESGCVHIAWIDARGGTFEQIYYRRSGPSGWEPEIALTNGQVTHYHPSIALAGGDVCLAYWQNEADDMNSEIFFRRCVAGVWTPDFQISNSDGKSELPCLIAESNGNLHLAWVDSRDGNQEIYYREYIDPANGTGDKDDGGTPEITVELAMTSSPNPFRGSTSIELSVPEGCQARIAIYDAAGRRVRELFSKTLCRGSHSFVWDGADDAGRTVAAGIYFAAGSAGKARTEKKIVFLK